MNIIYSLRGIYSNFRPCSRSVNVEAWANNRIGRETAKDWWAWDNVTTFPEPTTFR